MGGDSIVCKGETVDEAIENGLQQLGVSRELVGINILDKGKKGLLSLRSKPAIVKLTLLEKQQLAGGLVQGRFSLEMAVKNGVLSFTSEKADGQAFITLSPEIKFYKNGMLIDCDETTITATDTYEIDFLHKENETNWKIALNDQLKKEL